MILSKINRQSIDIDYKINNKIKNGKLNELLIIVPTNRKSRYLKKELISFSPNGSTAKINIETIGTYSTKMLFNNFDSRSRIISEAAVSVLLKQSFQEVKLKYFSHYKKEIPAGTLERVKNVISEYKKNGITPETIKQESQLLEGSEKLKAEDIAEVYGTFQKKFLELGLDDIGDIYFKLNGLSQDEFTARFRGIYPEVDLLLIHGFDEFTIPEIEIINKTADVPGLELYLYLDYYSFNTSIFYHLDKCYSKFIAKGFLELEDKSNSTLNDFHNQIRANLFSFKEKHRITRYQNNLFSIEARDRVEEIELIAKEIKELIIKNKIEPHNICVVFNLIQNYSPLIRDIFSYYKIPFNLTDRYLLGQDSIVTALINFLEIIENDFYYKNIFRALSLNYLKIQGIDLSNILKASVNLRIISGYNAWINSLNQALNQPSNNERNEDGITDRERQIYQKALEDISKLYNLLKPFARTLTVSEFQNEFNTLIFNFDIHTILVNSKVDNAERNIKAFESFNSTISELLDLLRLEYDRNEKFPLKFFLNNLRTAIAATRYNIKEKPGYGVQITTANEIRGLKFDYLFISGLCDGDFPTRYTPEIFFSGSFIKNEKNHQTEERYHFYQALCSWKKRLYLSYPKMEERRELVRSNFIDDFLTLFSVTQKTSKDYAENIYNQEELLKYLGRKGISSSSDDQALKHLEIDLDLINKSLDINKFRSANPFSKSDYTGYVSKEYSLKIKNSLENMSDKEYSISQLETYAKCPYKYFAERILNLEPVEEPTEELEALEMGSLLHSILYEFYLEMKKRKMLLPKASESQFKQAEDLIFSIAARKIEMVNFNKSLSFFEIEKILGINGNRKDSILYKFLQEEKNNEEGFVPEYFELNFGKTNHNQQEFAIGSTKLRGKIDRLDINHSKRLFKVIDYKLGGKKPTADELMRGLSLQLPLYMYAAKHLIQAQLQKDYEPASGEIYSLKYQAGKFGPMPISLKRGKTTHEENIQQITQLINICIEAVKKYIRAIQEGKFHLSELEDRESKVCQYCNFRPICRIQEVE